LQLVMHSAMDGAREGLREYIYKAIHPDYLSCLSPLR